MLRSIDQNNGLAQRLALIRFYFNEEPKTIARFSKLWNQLDFALRFEGKLKDIEIEKG